MKTNIVKSTNVTKQRKTIMNKLKKYVLGSQSLAVLSGVLGQTAISSAVTVNLTLDGPNVGETFIAGGGGTGGNSVIYNLDASSVDQTDKIYFAGTPSMNGSVLVFGIVATVFSSDSALPRSAHFYSIGSTVDGSLNEGSGAGYVYNGDFGGPQDDWTVDHTGAIGFKTGDNQFAFINISWDVSAKTLTILGGKYESTASTGITVTAVPEPSEYAAALGLGALGLAYYRRRSGNKTRPKNN